LGLRFAGSVLIPRPENLPGGLAGSVLADWRACETNIDRAHRPKTAAGALAYLSVAPISLNTVLTYPPTVVTAAMMNTAIMLAAVHIRSGSRA
jgi:hypothetical protein